MILEVAAELHPKSLTTTELFLEIASDGEDVREIATAARAIRGLSESGLLRIRSDETVETTRAALRAVALLT